MPTTTRTRAAKIAPAAAADAPLTPALPALGAQAPEVELPADDGTTTSLARLRGQRVVLYFYPRDNTPGCTTESCDFRDRSGDFTAVGAVILGVSGDSVASHVRFRDKFQLPFRLLADAGNRVARAYGAFGTKTSYGRTTEGIIRSTFVIGPDGRIEAVYSPVKVAGHAEAVLAALRGRR